MLDNKDLSLGFAVNFSPGIRLAEIANISAENLTITGTSDVNTPVETLPISATCNAFMLGQIGRVSVSVEFDFDDEASCGQVLQSLALFVRDEYLTKPKEFKTNDLKFEDVAPVVRLVWLSIDDWWEVVMEEG